MSARSILVVGSVALDDIRTPFGEVREAFGGSASYFSLAARFFAPVQVVAVVGRDFPQEHMQLLRERDIDTRGLEVADGACFRWGGEYGYDLNARKTLFTHLNVFEHFHPKVPAEFRGTPYVFLGNIHPSLQAEVLEQVDRPELVALDTMNLWIDTAREDLVQVLRSVDLVILNDSEARELAEEPNLIRAGRRLLELGPSTVVIKKGEHGAVMLTDGRTFCYPAIPLEEVFDPTGAGDAFGGGVLGHLAATGDHSDAGLRRAIAYGTVLASFTVQDFGVQRLREVQPAEIDARYRELRNLTHFDTADRPEESRP
ncbi:MAG: PfkB family carbohydrate kinase [Candidatus Krumholzibacteriia bacterium]